MATPPLPSSRQSHPDASGVGEFARKPGTTVGGEKTGAGNPSAVDFEGLRLAVRDDGPPNGPLFVCAHGAGAPLTSAFLASTASALAERGVRVLRFHLPYMQRILDEGKRRPPDPMRRMERAMAAVLEAVLPGSVSPLFLGGKSMGARVAALVAGSNAFPVRGLVHLGFPLHAPGRPAIDRARILNSERPQLFVSGDRDPLATWDLLAGVVERLGPTATLLRIPGGNHDLSTSRRQPCAQADEWWNAVAAFIHRVAEVS